MFDGVDEIAERAAHTINCPRHHDIELAAARLFQHAIKSWSLVPPVGTADPVVDVYLDDVPTPPRRDFRAIVWFSVVCPSVLTRAQITVCLTVVILAAQIQCGQHLFGYA